MRLIEDGSDPILASSDESGRCRGMAMANLGSDTELFSFYEAGHGDPVQAVRYQFPREELVIGPDGDLVGVWMNGENIEWGWA